MSDPVKTALIAGLAAIIGGLITSFLLPLVNWGIEKRRSRLAYRKERIDALRKVSMNQFGTWDIIAESAEYSAMRGHLPKDVVTLIESPIPLPLGNLGRSGDWRVQRLLDEVAKVERKWGLI